MRYNHQVNLNRRRRGVGAIIGGVILAAILLTTVLVYFITILNNDQRRATYDIESAQINADRGAEGLKAGRDELLYTNGTGSYINTQLSNEGSLPLVVSYWSLVCINPGCPSPNDPLSPKIDHTLNAKESWFTQVGPVADGLHYRVDFITQRGNIVSAEDCVADLGAAPPVCIDNPGGGPDFSLTASPDLLIMQAGRSSSSTITVTSYNGFASSVALSTTSPNPDISFTFSPNTINPPAQTSVLTISATSTANKGTYDMIITGVSGSLVRTAQIRVSIIDDNSGAVTEGIIQGTGSMQLDFKAFGALYPQLGTRDGIDQSGWLAKVSSKYSSVHGYPGFQLMTVTASTGGGNPVSTTQIAVVESARNLDPSGEDLTLTRFTGINPALGAIQGSNSQLSYICHENPLAATVIAGLTAYNENTAFKVLPTTSVDDGMTAGWQEMYFCTTSAGTNPNWFTPADLKFANLTPLFLVGRGDFADGSPYSQTIPYQAFTIGKGPGTSILNACLLSGDTPTTCPSQTTSQAANAQFKYDALASDLPGGVRVWLHLNSGTTITDGIDIRWLHPDGTYETIRSNQPASVINANRNIPVDLPTGINCNSPGVDEYHTLVFNDGRDSNGDRYIYYFTFKVDC